MRAKQVRQRRGRHHLGEAAWQELLVRFEEGDETIQAFCEREGVSKSTFNRRRSRRAMAHHEAGTCAPGEGAKAVGHSGFVDLGALCAPRAGEAGPGRLELTLDLGGGVTLRVARG